MSIASFEVPLVLLAFLLALPPGFPPVNPLSLLKSELVLPAYMTYSQVL